MRQNRILIVDDDAMILDLLQISIGCLLPECQVIAAVDGAAALAELQQQPFDLILTDYDMPGMNGLDLAQAAHKISTDIPIVLMTADYSGDEIKTRAGSADLAGFLAKPFGIRQLIDTLRENAI
jgi:CheY-like chemotaxis protein